MAKGKKLTVRAPKVAGGLAGVRPPKDDELTFAAMFYVLRTGIPWRDLPERFGP